MWGTAASFADVNNDGRLDLLICGYDSPTLLYINTDRGFREQSASYNIGFKGATSGAAFADYDRDGDLDLFLVTERWIPSESVDEVPMDHDDEERPRVKEQYRQLNHLKKHRDGSFVAVPSGQYDHLFRNDGGRFVDVTEEVGIGQYPYHGMAAVWWDYNNDQWPDIYVSNNFKDEEQLLSLIHI